ncbi:MAG: fibronectin type III domain-containing protein, partial [Robiginitomaculum sp.]|nr:fibronectin type III domain-containing protein [Robiginitomaculum sp.]
ISAVTATATSGASGATATTFTLPSSPLTLTGTRGDTVVSLFWTAPLSDGGAPITDYIIQHNDGSGWITFDDGVGLNTSTTVTNLTNGMDYLLQALAINSVGTGSASNIVPAMPATIPDTPAGMTSILGNTQVSLSWNTPSNGGEPIFNYLVEFNDGTGWTEFPESISLTSVTVDNLSNGQAYQFRASAQNTIGFSPASTPVSVTPATLPGIVTGLSAIPDNKQVSLSWVAPSDGGSPITDYIIEYSTDNGVTWTTFTDGTSTGTSTIVIGLSNGRDYQFRVSAVNDIGNGDPSTTTTATPITVAASPTGLTATTFSSTQINLSWNAPTSSGGSTVTGYLIERYDDVTETFEPLVDDTGSTTTTHSDTELDSGIKYEYRVSAITEGGTGDPSGKSSATTLSVPSAPTNLTATPGNTQVLLSWTASTGGGVPLTDYIIEYSDDAGTNWTVFADGTSTIANTIVTGLTNGLEYQFRVHAINSVGDSDDSNPVTEIPYTLPDAPFFDPDPTLNQGAARGPADAKLSWTAPANNGRTITDYIVEISSDAGSTWTVYDDGESPDNFATVLELVPGQTTQFRVAATNLAGTGGYSTTVSATPAIAPEPPTGLFAFLDTESQDSAVVQLIWSPPTFDGGASITQYIIEISDDDFLTKQNLLHSGTSFTLTELLNGIDYSFRVKSINTVGTSAPSDPVFVSVFDKPSFNVRIIATPGDGQVFLEWDNPAESNGNDILGYLVRDQGIATANDVEYDDYGAGFDDFRDADGDGLDDFSFDEIDPGQIDYGDGPISEVTSITITGLTNTEKYVFEIAPFNAAGPARSTNTVVVIPLGDADNEFDSSDAQFVENPTLDSTQSTNQQNKGRTGDSIPPSSSVVSGTAFDSFDDSYNQSIIYTIEVDPEDLDDPQALSDAYGLPEYSPPAELDIGEVWTVPPAIIELDEGTAFDDVVVINPAGAPTGLTATSGQSNQIPLSWVAPTSNGGSAVTGYIVEYSFEGTDWYAVDQTISTTSYTFPNSIDGHDYSFRVSAVNAAGIGDASTPPVVAKSFSVPKAPTNVVTGSTSATVSLLWTAPDNGGASITDYVIETSTDGVDWSTYADGTSAVSLATVMGLANDVPVYLRVSATNAAGTGLPSSVVSEIPAETANQPNGLTVSTVSSSEINITWNGPGNANPIGYKIERSISNVWVTIVANTNSISTSYTDSGLFAGTDYIYRISSITSSDTSDPSGVAQATTFDLPDAPTSLSIGATSSSLHLTWIEPSNEGGTPITSYFIERQAVGAEFETLVSSTGNTSTIYDDTDYQMTLDTLTE